MVLAVIPARYAAQRFPGKPLALIAGKSMIQRVWEQTRQARRVDEVVVATDDPRIADAVKAFGGTTVMTDPALPSGTDRCAAVARGSGAQIVLNVQGDEPLMDPPTIDRCIEALEADATVGMSTPMRPLTDPAEADNPNVVKVVTDLQLNALYFSRSRIPHWRDAARGGTPPTMWAHIGLYCYRRALLLDFAGMAPTALEEAERLEQLRLLENGARIRMVRSDYVGLGVDVPEDVAKVEERIRAGR